MKIQPYTPQPKQTPVEENPYIKKLEVPELWNSLTPAEILFLLHGHSCSQHDLLKYTLYDLFYRNTLTVDIEEMQSHRKDPVRSVPIVKWSGKVKYRMLKAHEQYIVRSVFKRKRKSTPFNYCQRLMFQTVSHRFYLKYVLKSRRIRKFTPMKGFLISFGILMKNNEGRRIGKAIQNDLRTIRKNVNSMFSEDPVSGFQLMSFLKGNWPLATLDDPNVSSFLSDEDQRRAPYRLEWNHEEMEPVDFERVFSEAYEDYVKNYQAKGRVLNRMSHFFYWTEWFFWVQT